MTDIEKKALALLNEVRAEYGYKDMRELGPSADHTLTEALCRAIERHEAFRQEVSDVVVKFFADGGFDLNHTGRLTHFIIAKPDPLERALRDAACDLSTDDFAEALRAAIAKHGGKIVWEDEQ